MVERPPHGYTDATRGAGATVCKRHLGPVPVLRRMPGIPGQEVLVLRPAAALESVGFTGFGTDSDAARLWHRRIDTTARFRSR